MNSMGLVMLKIIRVPEISHAPLCNPPLISMQTKWWLIVFISGTVPSYSIMETYKGMMSDYLDLMEREFMKYLVTKRNSILASNQTKLMVQKR